MNLKDLYSPVFLHRLGQSFQEQLSSFDGDRFEAACQTPDWEELKLMERRDRIVACLHDQLPADFTAAAPLIRAVGPQFTGLAAVCLPHYVATYGLNEWALSMDLLAELTRFSSAEFAIRPFLVREPAATSQQMWRWTQSPDADVRRLASEGMRPRLPWGIRLTQFIDDPLPVLAVLKQLITDESPYVQKSVANNLNDISKDHPDLVVTFAQRYWNQTSQTNWMLTRGLRTLFKQGNPAVLALQGYALTAKEQVRSLQFTPAHQLAQIGQTTRLHYQFRSTAATELPLYLGYRVHYVRQRGATTTKDFFLKRVTLAAGAELTGEVTIPWRQLTTRHLYAGEHVIELLVNTQPIAASRVILTEA